ncbi:hypothetical protein ABEB36_000257 [Hypothenemus hampei]|uniref:Uncharacterized protein n=1 Tax=Hypothenemus hampei TaxID=57062 RepID=A0ABD1FCJ2_HYPHA
MVSQTDAPQWERIPLTPVRENELGRAEQLIRSVLLSTPGPLSIAELRREHLELIGREIPFREFDFRLPCRSCALYEVDLSDPEEAYRVYPLVASRNRYMRALVLATLR